MTILTKSILLITAMILSPIVIACDYPSRPNSIPNGATATKEEMLAGVTVINDYQGAMSEYLTCIEAERVVADQAIDETDAVAKQQSQEMFNKKYNAAVDEQTLIVEEFNTQIRDYKAKSK